MNCKQCKVQSRLDRQQLENPPTGGGSLLSEPTGGTSDTCERGEASREAEATEERRARDERPAQEPL